MSALGSDFISVQSLGFLGGWVEQKQRNPWGVRWEENHEPPQAATSPLSLGGMFSLQ